jgi:glycosyltransferase involved in cell wall biosynthesis
LKRSMAGIAMRMLAAEGKPIRLRFERTICVSQHVRDRLLGQGLIGPESVVIPNGVDPGLFHPTRTDSRLNGRPLRGLVAGRVAPEKGIHTLLEALGILRERNRLGGFRLTILGDGPKAYAARLAEQVGHHGLAQVVTFAGLVDIQVMPEVLARHDVLILASEWEEPMANIVLEAMAMGLLVIASPTGGTAEVVSHGSTGLLFEAGRATDLAERIAEVIADPRQARRLAEAGRKTVAERHDMRANARLIEGYLRLRVAPQGSTRVAGSVG